MIIQIGDRITFRAATRWSGAKVTRVVNGFWQEDLDRQSSPTVRYGGWGNFIVYRREILEVIPAD
jgi:hypothetical protein